MNDVNLKQTVLVVDDTTDNIDVISGVLRAQYKVKAATSGERALKIASASPPDLILLDIMMPEMDGYETCTRLKALPDVKDVPIIFLTAKTQSDDIVKGFDVGAVDYVTKPFNPAELKSRVSTHLALRNAQRAIEDKNAQLTVLANKLSKYLSPQVYDSIFTGEKDVKIETSTKFLTVMFSDIVGFTNKSDTMSSHELSSWLNNYLNEMARITLKYEGTLDKFIGDAVMVFFGDPKTLGKGKDAVQCVRMAQEMQAKAKEMGVEIRVGINSGECTVGNFGSDDRMEYTIIGREVNLAARLEHHSQPGRILISESTRGLLEDQVQGTQNREPIQVKGIEKKIHTTWVPGMD